MEIFSSIRMTKPEESQSDKACGGKASESQEVKDNVSSEALELALVEKFYKALQDTYNVNWIRHSDYISPGCFLYLVERFLILVSRSKGFFYTTKSSLVEWLISEEPEVLRTSKVVINRESLEMFYDSVLRMVQQLLLDKHSTVQWITQSEIKFEAYYKLLVMRLVVILCLLCVNSGKFYDVLFHVLRNYDVRNQLPKNFYGVLVPGLKQKYIQISEIGKAFQIAGDHLLFVNMFENTTTKFPNVIHVQLGTNCNVEDILDLLFPTRNESQAPTSTAPEVMNNASATSSSDCGDQPKILTTSCSEVSPPLEQNLQQVNWDLFQEVSDFLKLNGSKNDGTTSTVAKKMKEEIHMHIKFLTAAVNLPTLKKPDAAEDMVEEMHNMLQELLQLYSFLDTSNSEVAIAEQLLKSLMSRKPKLEAVLNQCIVPTTEKDSCEEIGNTVCVEDEKIESPPSIAADSESSNKVTERKQPEKGEDQVQEIQKGQRKKEVNHATILQGYRN